jgi:hypothetical protein
MQTIPKTKEIKNSPDTTLYSLFFINLDCIPRVHAL